MCLLVGAIDTEQGISQEEGWGILCINLFIQSPECAALSLPRSLLLTEGDTANTVAYVSNPERAAYTRHY